MELYHNPYAFMAKSLIKYRQQFTVLLLYVPINGVLYFVTYIYIYIYIYTYVYIYISTHTHTHTRNEVQVTCVCVCVYIYTHTYIQIYICICNEVQDTVNRHYKSSTVKFCLYVIKLFTIKAYGWWCKSTHSCSLY